MRVDDGRLLCIIIDALIGVQCQSCRLMSGFFVIIVPLLCVAFCMQPHEYLPRVPCDGVRLFVKNDQFFLPLAAVHQRCRILDISRSFMHTDLVVTIDLMHVRRVQILVMRIIRRPVPAD